MSAKDHIQLQMFMPAGKLKAMQPGDQHRDETTDQLWERKTKEAVYPGTQYDTRSQVGVGPSLADSIKEHGIKTPVAVMHSYVSKETYLANGHHRVAAADNINPSMEIPIEHFGSARYTMGRGSSFSSKPSSSTEFYEHPQGSDY